MKTLWLTSSLVFVTLLGCQTLPNEPSRGTQPTPTPTPTVSPTASPVASPVVPVATASPPTVSVSFANDIQPIFNQSCTQCHEPGGIGLGDWTASNSYRNLVNTNSGQKDSLVLVQPGDSANSLLYLKVSQDKPPVGSRMPLGGAPLGEKQQELIKVWIDAGAPNN